MQRLPNVAGSSEPAREMRSVVIVPLRVALFAIKLTEEEIKRIRTLAEELDWTNKGARYPPGMEEFSGVDTPAE